MFWISVGLDKNLDYSHFDNYNVKWSHILKINKEKSLVVQIL